MLAELFAAIQKQALEAATPKIITPPNEPEGVYLVAHNGQVERRMAAEDWRDQVAFDLATLVDLATSPTTVYEAAEIWYSRIQVSLVAGDPRNKSRFLPQTSPQMAWVEAAEKSPQWKKQQQLCDLLKTLFIPIGQDADRLREIVSKVRFVQGQTAEMQTIATKRSVGRSIESEVTGTGAIPEFVQFTVPVWSNLPFTHTVRLALDCDPGQETFRLQPLAGETERAFQAGERYIHESLMALLEKAGLEAPVYYGVA